MRRLLLFLLTFCFLLSACKSQKKPNLSVAKYKEQGVKMLQICLKLANDLDAERMHKAAWSIEKARVVSCFSYKDECVLYGKCLSRAIAISKDKKITGAESQELKELAQNLRESIATGVEELEAEWASIKESSPTD